MEIVPAGEVHRHELYRRGDELSGPIEFVGTFSHNLEVRETNDHLVNESLLKLQKSYNQLNEEKAAST
jgi:RNA polymerase II elongation factor ELL